MSDKNLTFEEKKELAKERLLYDKDVENKIAYITINRPDKLNAPDAAMRLRYGDLIHRANIDDDVKVLVIRAVGDHFGGGADVPEQSDFHTGKDETTYQIIDEFEIDDPDVTYPPPGSYRHMFGMSELYTKARAGCRSLQEFKKISILEAKGYNYGWHFYQTADVDIVIASDDALFGHPAYRYAGWGPRMWTWADTMGIRKFMEMVFTGRPFTAQEMYDCNYINSIVPRDQLEDEVNKYALACSRSRPTDTVVAQKTFFEVMKQHRGEYMGSILTAWLEGMGPFMSHDSGEVELDEAVSKGLNIAVKENEKNFPPEWRHNRTWKK